MNILYRRFALVAVLITALGIVTSIIIQETRPVRPDAHVIGWPGSNAPLGKSCENGLHHCSLLPASRPAPLQLASV